MKIVLLGYMASGKSSIGKRLSEVLDLNFIDLDTYIESCDKMSIKDIFKNKGEIYFRRQESIYLQEVLAQATDCVLSLGGGTPCYGNNTQLLNSTGYHTVYLRAGIATLVDRLTKEKQLRPLVAQLSSDQLTEYVAKHLFERAAFYEQAKQIISIDNKSVEEICKEIKLAL
ncbi:shikimate kinase [Polaribacter pacificus]|uniref:Shikimate kinase n=1 Tax=Polaribacter pacificus TaxID=1775173 RepID=A0A917ME93_9FLAO|nr:shikimate kinase [Polaribacter pacificus]GGG98147.1 shikimate kinase [Polaribacter pacificus]